MRFALALLLASGVSSVAATYSDSTFLNTDWTTTVLHETVPAASSAGGSQQTDGANTFWRVEHNYDGYFIVGHLRPSFTYDPGVQGGIASLDVSYKYKKISSSWAPGQIASSVLLLQSGFYYYAAATDFAFGSESWLTKNNPGLTAASFSSDYFPQPGAPGAPDFSASGAPITFGFYTANSTTFQMTTVSGYDDFAVTVQSQVPEPSTGLLAATALAASCMLRRARRT